MFSFGIPFCLLLILIYLRKDIKELARLEKIEEGLKTAAKATFANFDIDGDGTISPTELRVAMAELGHALSEQECAVLFVKMDVDGDGNISESEFTNMAVTFKAAESTMSKLGNMVKGGVSRLRSLSRGASETKTTESEAKSANDEGGGGKQLLKEQEKHHLRYARDLAVLYSIYKP